MRNAHVDQARLLASRHHLDRKSERGLGLFQKCGGILGDAQGIGADRAHCVRIEAAQAFAETPDAVERAVLGVFVEALFAVEARAEADRLAQGIERVELITDDARNLQVERVGSEVNCGERGVNRHFISMSASSASVYQSIQAGRVQAKYR